MKKLILVPILIVGLLLSVMGGLAFAQTPDKAQGHAPDQILVKFLPGTSQETKAGVHKRYGSKVVDVIPGIDVQVVRIPENKVAEKVRAYKGEASVEFAEPDYVAEAILTPNDPYFGKQWGMVKIHAPEAWDITTGSPGVKIAICDTGIDQNHEDLAAKIVGNKNFTQSRTVDDNYGHGTHVAGIAAAITNNGKGVAGVGFDSSLMNVKVLGDTGSGYYSWVANGINWAANNGAKVINLSLGGSSASDTLESAVNYAWGKGCVLVAAVGNDNTSAPLYPAYYENCIAVAATDQNDAKASFSNYGAWVDIAAPGVDIFSTLPNHRNRIGILNYGSLSGTSMSTPHVAGLAGLVWATEYGTSQVNVRSRIEGTADEAGTMWSTYGIKRINAYNAVVSSAPNNPPGAENKGVITDEDTSVIITLSGSDVDGDNLTFSMVAGPSNGTLGTIVSTGVTTAEVQYNPTTDYVGTDSFTYKAYDGKAYSDIATVSITVKEPAPAAPTAVVSIDMSKQTVSRWWRATATVAITSSEIPLTEAIVYGKWSGVYTGEVSGTTNGEGKVSFKTGHIRQSGTVTFTVTRVVKGGQEYILSGETTDSISK